MKLTTVILTFNEARHIERAIESVRAVSDLVVVVDSGSTDGTREIAARHGARVLEHRWTNYAVQHNWALAQLPPTTGWVLRLDADEIVTPALAAEIAARLPLVADDVAGIRLSRRMTFMGRPIRWGGVFPLRVLRLFRHGRGRCENRWMDEHIVVDGPTADFEGEILDDNLNDLTWWTQKHNAYACREVVDLLNLEHNLWPDDRLADLDGRNPVAIKRWLKERIYARLPRGLRAFGYFAYRYVVRLGFLDGYEGAAFHVLQGFWYRFLVDAKLTEVRRHMKENGTDVPTAIDKVLGIKVEASAFGNAGPLQAERPRTDPDPWPQVSAAAP